MPPKLIVITIAESGSICPSHLARRVPPPPYAAHGSGGYLLSASMHQRHTGAGLAACARNTGARLSAGGLLNELEYRCLLLCVEPIPCLREPDTALGAER